MPAQLIPIHFPVLSERLLQFIWNLGYFNTTNLTTTTGEALSIIHRGTLNKDQGPDFSNGRIRIGNTTLAGNIELHLKTSDWRRHRHQSDSRYGNVILHVVYEHDEVVNDIPVLEIGQRIPTLLLNRYTQFMETQSRIACGEGLQKANAVVWAAWKERLLAERLTRKAAHVLQALATAGNHWEEAFWWSLAKGFGGKVNGEAFEAVARSLPVNIIAKHRHSIHQIEALLFGQAGLLDSELEEEYPRMLAREYRFLKQKYGLQPSTMPLLFLRMRPGSFPTVRLAQLAALITFSHHLFSKIVEETSLSAIKQLFSVTANDFWHYHYTFKQASPFKPKTLGEDTIQHLIINCVAPMLFAYGDYHNQEHQKAKALRWLEELPAESNRITKDFAGYGMPAATAFDSQALIELKNEYCTTKRCLDCAVGVSILKEAAVAYGQSY